MELSPTSDFVIRRKRKRHAVDPCLGFYTSPNSNTLFSPQRSGAHVESCVATSTCRTEIKGLLYESSNVTSPLTEPEQTNLTNTLTVEEFLKRSHNPAPNVRVYGRKKVKVVDLNASSTTGEKTNAAELDDKVISLRSRNIRRGSAPENSGLESPSPHSSPIQRKKKKIVKSLGDRLFHAAVQSGGDPIDNVVEAQDTDSFRKPLQFSPDDDCGLVSSKRRAWTLVDPRKAVPFRSATFSSRRIAPSTSEAQCQPLSRWRAGSSNASSFIGLKPQEQKVSRRTQIKSLPRRVDDRVPLSFVPLLQAETTPCRPKSNQAKTVSSLDRSGRPEQLAFEVVELNSSQANQNTEDLRPTSSPSLIACAPSSPISSVHRSEKTTPVAPSILPTCLDTASCQHSNFPEKKDLKPLASFFDGFLETARVVTENEANGSLQTPCPETARKSTMDWRQLMPSTLNSLQSFIRKSVKNPNVPQVSRCQTPIYIAKCSSVPRKRHPSDHFLHIPQVSNHGSLSLRPLQSGREAGDYDPDPNILIALQPQSYQVILSSSPVFNSSAPASAATTASSPSSTALIPDNLGLKGFCQFLR